jgi:hypothetical protein
LAHIVIAADFLVCTLAAVRLTLQQRIIVTTALLGDFIAKSVAARARACVPGRDLKLAYFDWFPIDVGPNFRARWVPVDAISRHQELLGCSVNLELCPTESICGHVQPLQELCRG